MQKMVIMVVAALALTVGAYSVDLEGNPPPFLSQKGGGIEGGMILGKRAGSATCIGIPLYAAANVTAGDLMYLSSSRTASPTAASAGALTPIGVALTTVSTGEVVQVCTDGIAWATCVSANATAGLYMVASGIAGKITPVSALDGTLYTGVSATAIVGYVVVAKAVTAADSKVLIKLLK